MRKIKIIILVLILATLFSPILARLSYATDESSSQIKQELEDFGKKSDLYTEKTDPAQFVGKIIKWVIAILGVVLIAMIIYGGFMYATSAGNEKQTETAKKILTYAILGLIIIAIAYAVTLFVLRVFFPPNASTLPRSSIK